MAKCRVVLSLAAISIIVACNFFLPVSFSRFIALSSIEKIEFRNALVFDISYDDGTTSTNVSITSSEKYETDTVITAHEFNNNGAKWNFKNNEDDNIIVVTHQTDSLLCTRKQIQKGYWKNVQREKAPYESKEKWESSCYQHGGFREGQLQQSPFNDWEWNVDDDNDENCVLLQFDVNRFCRLGINRTIAFLGDSITWQQFQSLNFLIGATDEHRKQALIKTHACSGNTTKLIWERDNKASANGLKRIIQTSDPDVLVINRGAHFTENEMLLSELNATLTIALIWQKDCDKRNRDCLLLWRTTAPGYPNCDQILGPISISNRSIAESFIMDRSKYTEEKGTHHWWDFANQNVLVESLIQHHIKVNQLRISFIDFYDMAILRPDHHINKQDCLHWCLPGPIDAANTILLHELEVAASKKNR